MRASGNAQIRRIKILGLLILAAFACLGVAGVNAATPVRERGGEVILTEAERDWIAAHPQVRWGFDPDWPPFSSFDHYHRLVGIDADLTRLAARRAGLQLSMVSGNSWSEVYAKAKAGEVDF